METLSHIVTCSKVKNCHGSAEQVKIEEVRGDELVMKSVRRVKDRLEKMEKMMKIF